MWAVLGPSGLLGAAASWLWLRWITREPLENLR